MNKLQQMLPPVVSTDWSLVNNVPLLEAVPDFHSCSQAQGIKAGHSR